MPQDESWRPKVTRIDDPIADDYWEYVTPKGRQRVSRLTVGRPVHHPKEGLWYCPVRIEGYTRPRIKPIFGSGPVDSLMNAMTFVRGFFEANSGVLPGAKPRKPRRPRTSVPRAKSPKTPRGGKRPRPPSR